MSTRLATPGAAAGSVCATAGPVCATAAGALLATLFRHRRNQLTGEE